MTDEEARKLAEDIIRLTKEHYRAKAAWEKCLRDAMQKDRPFGLQLASRMVSELREWIEQDDGEALEEHPEPNTELPNERGDTELLT